jgi:hypothetical protein
MITNLARRDSIELEVTGRRARSPKTGRSLRHIVGPNVRTYRLLLEEQRAQLAAMIDQITAPFLRLQAADPMRSHAFCSFVGYSKPTGRRTKRQDGRR